MAAARGARTPESAGQPPRLGPARAAASRLARRAGVARAMISEVDRLDTASRTCSTFSRPAPLAPDAREPVRALVERAAAARNACCRTERRSRCRTRPAAATCPTSCVDPMQSGAGLTRGGRQCTRRPAPGGRHARVTARASADGEAGGGSSWRSPTPATGIPGRCCPRCSNRSSPRGPEGTGLGLAIASGFVEQNGGRWTSASRPGEGTTVRFDFPAARRPPRTRAAHERRHRADRRRRAHPGPRHQGASSRRPGLRGRAGPATRSRPSSCSSGCGPTWSSPTCRLPG